MYYKTPQEAYELFDAAVDDVAEPYTIAGVTYSPHEVFKAVDRLAYEKEFEEWQDEERFIIAYDAITAQDVWRAQEAFQAAINVAVAAADAFNEAEKESARLADAVKTTAQFARLAESDASYVLWQLKTDERELQELEEELRVAEAEVSFVRDKLAFARRGYEERKSCVAQVEADAITAKKEAEDTAAAHLEIVEKLDVLRAEAEATKKAEDAAEMVFNDLTIKARHYSRNNNVHSEAKGEKK